MMSAKFDGEWRQLLAQIEEWNSNRLDLFALSQPNENLEFFGVMRFFYQDESDKVSTKCIRVASTATTRDVMATLIEKFRPDMRMLSPAQYALYEVHVNGEERPLRADELPLLVQLNWGKDDREGRFLLKRENEKTRLPQVGDFSVNSGNQLVPKENVGVVVQQGSFKRKLSKREKKELKKKEKEQQLLAKPPSEEKSGIAQRLYNELPESSFTRSISNPELVMRKRRQLKLEKKLQQIRSNDGGPDSGGTLKIYGSDLNPDVPYKTLLLSVSDNAAHVVRETLEKYGMEKEDPYGFCLIQVLIPPDGPDFGKYPRECVLADDECPLAILLQHPPSKGTVMFHIRRRTFRREISQHPMGSMSDRSADLKTSSAVGQPQKALPYLMEVNPDGKEAPNGKRYRIMPNMSEVGSDYAVKRDSQYLQVLGPGILPRHCVISNTPSSITITPLTSTSIVFVNGKRIAQTTDIRHGDFITLGNSTNFMLIERVASERQTGFVKPTAARSSALSRKAAGDLETTFDVDGHVETVEASMPQISAVQARQVPDVRYGPPGYEPDLLPAMLTFGDEAEDHLLASVISEINGAAMQFRLAPAYTLYMILRSRASHLIRPDLTVSQREKRVISLASRMVRRINHLIRDNQSNPGVLAFWLANASELMHFMKRDTDIGHCTQTVQNQLAETIQMAFSLLIDLFQIDLANLLPAFLSSGIVENGHMSTARTSPKLGNVLQVLTTAMTLLRRCRVNAALTIQMFSQLFHFINIWLFNRFALEPRLQLCTQEWGNRLRNYLGHIQAWAEKQGLELAADCHLAKATQIALVLETPKTAYQLMSLLPTCDSLNSLQLRALLCNYISAPGEVPLSSDVVKQLVAEAANRVDAQLLVEGREITVEELLDLQLPFLLPEDGYSCDYVKGMPPGLAEFIETYSETGVCRLIANPNASGLWTVHMTDYEESPTYQNLDSAHLDTPLAVQVPEVIIVAFNKLNNSLGLSIVAAKGDNQSEKAIYVKSVVPDGAAERDGRLETGDQLVEVDGQSLIGVSQEKAAQMMSRAGQLVTLKVAKQAAVYHGLSQLLTRSPPDVFKANVNSQRNQTSVEVRQRPKSEDVMKYNQTQKFSSTDSNSQKVVQIDSVVSRSLQQQHEARSTPVLSEHDFSQKQHMSTLVAQSNPNFQRDSKPVYSSPNKTVSLVADNTGHLATTASNDLHVKNVTSPTVDRQFDYRPDAESSMSRQSIGKAVAISTNRVDSEAQQNPEQRIDQKFDKDFKSVTKPSQLHASRQPGYATQILFPHTQQSKLVVQSSGLQKASAVVSDMPGFGRHNVSPLQSASNIAANESPSSGWFDGANYQPTVVHCVNQSLSSPVGASHVSAVSLPADLLLSPATTAKSGKPPEPAGQISLPAAQSLSSGNSYSWSQSLPMVQSSFQSPQPLPPEPTPSVKPAMPNTFSEVLSDNSPQQFIATVQKPVHAQTAYENDFPPPPSDLLLEQLKPALSYNKYQDDSRNADDSSLGQGLSGRIQPAFPQHLHAGVVGAQIQPPSKKPPPVPAKPKVAVVISNNSNLEDKSTASEESARLQRLQEIRRLESRPYLTANEQAKLQRLRVEADFDKKLQEVEDDDSKRQVLTTATELSGEVRKTNHFNRQLMEPERAMHSSFDKERRLRDEAELRQLSANQSETQPPRPPLPQSMPSYSHDSIDMPKSSPSSRVQAESTTYAWSRSQTDDGYVSHSMRLPNVAGETETVNFGPLDQSITWQQDAKKTEFDQLTVSNLQQTGALEQPINYLPADIGKLSPSYGVNYQLQTPARDDQPVVLRNTYPSTSQQVTSSPLQSVAGALKPRNAAVSALKQPDVASTGTKKSVTFNDNIVTEYSFNRSYGSTSSESSFPLHSPGGDASETFDSYVAGNVSVNRGQDQLNEQNQLAGVAILHGVPATYPYRPLEQPAVVSSKTDLWSPYESDVANKRSHYVPGTYGQQPHMSSSDRQSITMTNT